MRMELFSKRKKVNQWFKKSLFFCLFIGFFVFQNQQSLGQYVTASGNKILDPSGKELFFTGMNLGNWLLWEGYLMMGDFNYRTHTQFFNSVKSAFGNDLTKALEFEHQWRINYVTEQAIIDLKNLGFNSVRVPFHFNMFWDWNTNTVRDHGFQYFDRVISFCRTHGLYVLLDMHAAPNYQNPGDHSDNVNSNASQPRETVKFWDGNNVSIAAQVWKHIANRYKNEPVVWGYDLINEPVPQAGREFELLPSLITMRNAIREVDNNHLIVAEGSWWGSDMQKLDWMDAETQSKTGITARWDSKLVYQTHHYSSDVSLLNGRLAICNKLGVPMILGEYGESDMTNLRNMTNWCITNKVSYFPWSFKKMSHDKCLWTINPNTAYNNLKNFINNGGTPPANIYNDMISFCQNNIANGAAGLVYHADFYNAVKNNSVPVVCTALALPGIIEAENYCTMSGIQTETTTDVGGGQNVGWIEVGDWLEYTVNVANAGTYDISARVASTGTTGKFHVEFGGVDKTGVLSVPNTGGWQTWSNVIKTGVSLSAGQQVMRVYMDGAGFNLNKITITSGTGVIVTGVTVSPTTASLTVGGTQQLTATVSPANATNKAVSWSSSNTTVATVSSSGLVTAVAQGTATITVTTNDQNKTATCAITVNAPAQTPYGGIAWAIPGTIEAENFDNGGENNAYHDNETANQGGQYRTGDGVDIETCGEGGYDVGWTNAGEWLEYTVNVTSAGTYTIDTRVASTGTTGSFRIEFGGVDKTGTLTVPNTGGWQTWANVTKTNVTLAAGQQIMRIYMVGSSFNINKVIITSTTNVPVTGVTVSPTSISLAAGATQQLTATVAPSNATNKTVTWSSGNTGVATVNSSGLVTAVAAGSATITVTTQDGAKTATCAVTVTASSTFPGYYNIFSVLNPTKGLDVQNNSTASGAYIQQYTITNGGGNNQRWRLDDAGSGYFYIKVKSTQMCLATLNAGTGDGVQVIQQTCNAANSQKWQLISLGSGVYEIVNVNGGKALDVKDVSTADGGLIQTWTYGGGNNQKWTFTMVESTKAASVVENIEGANASFAFFPNPANAYITVRQARDVEISSVEIYSLSGQLVLKHQAVTDGATLNISHLNSGVYYVKANSSKGIIYSKLVKR